MPNDRSLHTIPTPHGGGIAIALTWYLGLIYLFTCKEIDTQLFHALMIGVVLAIVGFIDDLYSLNPKIRLVIQAFVSGLGLYMIGGLSYIDFGFFTIENQMFINVLAFLGIMWCINLYNFLDGIDGYATMEVIFLSVAGAICFSGLYFNILGASALGFLLWNWDKAKIFMGDAGSTFLGYTIAIFIVYYQNQGVSIFVWLIFFELFWFDATLTLLRRYLNGEQLSKAHRKHAYQRLVQSGLGHGKVVLLGLCINVVLLILGYSALSHPTWVMHYFLISLVFLYCIIKIVDYRKKFEEC